MAIVLAGVIQPLLAADGFDTQIRLEAVVEIAADGVGPDGRMAGRWLRLAGMSGGSPARAGMTPEERRDELVASRMMLTQLKLAGCKLVGNLRWGGRRIGESDTRVVGGPGDRGPLDLRELFKFSKEVAEAYGDLVDVWEYANEPDIPFFADNADVFAACHKAVALGLAAGRARWDGGTLSNDPVYGLAGGLGDDDSRQLNNPRRRLATPSEVCIPQSPPVRSAIMMAAPGLPPGPHFDQLLKNGYLSYTEMVNYHYYGFAMDYAGVYGQFREAVTEFRTGREEGGSLKAEMPRVGRRLPVFLTEWGYSLLDGYDAQTAEGRVRQWRYFSDVARQNERLRVAAPMAFLLRPYFEIKAKEFGLSMPLDEARARHYGFTLRDEGGGLRPEDGSGERGGRAGFQPAFEASKPAGRDAGVPGKEPQLAGASGVEFRAGGLTFSPGDFGAKGVESWMERIGERVGEAEASPALAWLLDRGAAGSGKGRLGSSIRPRSGPRDWVVRTERPSPVVMDFVAGAQTKAVKSDHGYWLWGQVRAGETGGAPMVREGGGMVVFYNFGSVPAEVTPVWPEWIRPAEGGSELMLTPGERREVSVVLRARADRLLPVDARIAAEVRCGGTRTVSRWASRFYALPNGVVTREREGFDFPEAAAEANRALLLARPHAPEEPALRRDGRWLVTDGMRVEETDWGWRLHVDHFPGVALRPAVAELPLPEGWSMPTGALLSYDYRLIDGPGAVELSAASPDARLRRQTGIAGNLAESYIRTATGNLFGTQPRLSPTVDWGSYQQASETFTMHFLGRTTPPWRFAEHKPAALVFFVRPVRLPAIFEVMNPLVVEMEAGW